MCNSVTLRFSLITCIKLKYYTLCLRCQHIGCYRASPCLWLVILKEFKVRKAPQKQTQTLNKGGMEESVLKECGSSFNCWYARGTSCQEKKNPRKKQTEEMQNNPGLLLPDD